MTRRVKDAIWYAGTLAIALLVFAAIGLFAPPPAPPRPLSTAYYVWQMQWNDDVREAIRTADASANAFMVLVGEVNATGGELRLQRGYPDWAALAKTRAPVTIVLRANAALADMLQSDTRDKAIAFVIDALDVIIAEAETGGAMVRGIQLDYDCPSAKLASYKTLLDAIRPRFDNIERSITALPTWLKSRDFDELVGELAYYVLQVHSLEPPKSFDDRIDLCDTGRVPGYLRRAASINARYYLALPTYGYRFVFDEHGKFAAIVAEGPEPILKPGQRVRTATSDPEEIANVVRNIRANPPHGLLGVVWFRLPIATDALNWPWQTLEAVRDGRAPRTAFTVDLHNPSPGLYELYIVNTGETWPTQPIRTTLTYSVNSILASDTHNGFSATNSTAESTTLTGPAPRPDQSVLAAWFRVDSPRSGSGSPQIAAGRIEVQLHSHR